MSTRSPRQPPRQSWTAAAFGWLKPPKISVLEQYFRGVPLVPERELDCRPHGWRHLRRDAILVLPSRNNEAQSFAAAIVQNFVAPYARGHGLSKPDPAKAPKSGPATQNYHDFEPGRA